MKSWNSSPHPISDIRDWQRDGRLEIRPDFQRQYVWSDAAKVMLMDTILRGIPMPKIFLSSGIKDGQTYRTVIDGQQRITTILAFLEDKFALVPPYDAEFNGLKYSELPEPVRNSVLQYRIDFNEAIGFSDEELRETYSRLNKYSVALTKQELRRADFPGQFLQLSEELALHEFFDSEKLFTIANRRRLADVEFVSELLAGLIAGPQDKRETLDDFYLKYSKWDAQDMKAVETRFLAVLSDMNRLFDVDFPLSGTRFRQKADFYALMLAIDQMRALGGTLVGIELSPLKIDLQSLDSIIEPESEYRDGRDYAIKCVSQANTHASRRWRMEFLKAFLIGTYLKSPPSRDGAALFYRLASGPEGSMCPPGSQDCPVCGKDIEAGHGDAVGWLANVPPFQLSNISFIHPHCVDKSQWIVITEPDTDGPLVWSDDSQISLV